MFRFVILPLLLVASLSVAQIPTYQEVRNDFGMAKDFASLLEIPAEEYSFFVSGASNFLDVLDVSEGISYLKEGNYDKAFENFSKVGVSQIVNLIPYVNTMLTVLSFSQPFWDKVEKYVFDQRIQESSQKFVNLKMKELEKILEEDPLAFKGEDFKRWLETDDSIEVRDFLEDIFVNEGMKHGLYNVGNKVLNERDFASKPWYEKLKKLYLNFSYKAYTVDEVKHFWITQWRRELFKRGAEYVLKRKKEALNYFLSESTVNITLKINSPEMFVLTVPELNLSAQVRKEHKISSSLKDMKSRQITIVLKDLKGNTVYTKVLDEKDLFSRYDPWLSDKKSTYYVKTVNITPTYKREIVKNLRVQLPEEVKSATVTIKTQKTDLHVENSPSFSLSDLVLTLDEEIRVEAEIVDSATKTHLMVYETFVPSSGEIVLDEPKMSKIQFESEEEYSAYLKELKKEFLENVDDPNAVKVLRKKLEEAFYAFHANPLARSSFEVISYSRKFIGDEYRLTDEEFLFESLDDEFSSLNRKFQEIDSEWGKITYNARNLEHISSRTLDKGAVIPAYYRYVVQAKEDLQKEIEEMKSNLEGILNRFSEILEQAEELRKNVDQKIALDILFETHLIMKTSQLIGKIQEKIDEAMSRLNDLESMEIKTEEYLDTFLALVNNTYKKAEIYNTLVDQWNLLMKQGDEIKRSIEEFKPEYVHHLTELMKYDGINLFYLRENEHLGAIGIDEIAARTLQEFLKEEELAERSEAFNQAVRKTREQIQQYHVFHYYISLTDNDLKVDKNYRLVGNYYRYSIDFFDKNFPYKSIGISRELENVPELLEKFFRLREKLEGEDPEGDRLRKTLERLYSLSSFDTVEEFNAIIDEWTDLYEAYKQEDPFKTSVLSYSYINKDGRTVQKTYPTYDFLRWLSQRNRKNQEYILNNYLRRITDDPTREGYEIRDPSAILENHLVEATIKVLPSYKSGIMSEIDSLKKISRMKRKRKEEEIQKKIMTDPFAAVGAKVPEEIKDWLLRRLDVTHPDLYEEWNRTTSELQAYLEEVTKQ